MNALGSLVKKSCVLIESCFSANFRSETLKYFKSYSRSKKNIYREYFSLYKPIKQSYFNLSWSLMKLVLKWPVRTLVRLLCKHLELGNKIYQSFFKIRSLSACINSDEKYCSCIISFKFFCQEKKPGVTASNAPVKSTSKTAATKAKKKVHVSVTTSGLLSWGNTSVL